MPYSDKHDQQDYSHGYYLRNRSRILARTKVRNLLKIEANKAYVDALKSKPCTDCARTYHPYVMDFDHRGTDKRIDVSMMVTRAYGLKTILKEIAKCDLVCSNCHRLRTLSRRQKKSI